MPAKTLHACMGPTKSKRDMPGYTRDNTFIAARYFESTNSFCAARSVAWSGLELLTYCSSLMRSRGVTLCVKRSRPLFPTTIESSKRVSTNLVGGERVGAGDFFEKFHIWRIAGKRL